MTQTFDVEALIKLRSQTRAISDALKAQAADYLATVAALQTAPTSITTNYGPSASKKRCGGYR